MRYAELVQLYFERSNALQWYWTVYVVVIGGLLAFSSLRQRPDLTTVVLISALYLLFAYRNLRAIREVTVQRFAVLSAMQEASPGSPAVGLPDGVEPVRMRTLLAPTLMPPTYENVRNFHVICDTLTVAALWAMEWRRRRAFPKLEPVPAAV